jgi:2-polyprenyl-6-methoxyphenol hydroxylase-like FAD-dependent oxidoreductase
LRDTASVSDAEPSVVIVGGAVAGAALANALGSRGVRTLLVEKLDRERHGARGDLLHPPTLRILAEWDVLRALHDDGAIAIRELAVTHARRGLIARYEAPGRDGDAAGRTIAVPHDRIEAVLYECAARRPSVRVERGVITGLLRDGEGRVAGVRLRPRDGAGAERAIAARLVVGCDGTRSLIRRELEIEVDQAEYQVDFLYVEAEGASDPPAAVHWHLDDTGVLCVLARPRGACRVFLTWPRGERPAIGPDPALRGQVARRFPTLAGLRLAKANASLYRVVRLLARRFWTAGCAIAGDAAHTTHPAGATGMSLAIAGASRLAELVAPVLGRGGADAELDAALATYEAERRPAAARALEAAHAQALRLYEGQLFRDPEAYARAVDPRAAWTAGGAGWGQDPAALAPSRR